MSEEDDNTPVNFEAPANTENENSFVVEGDTHHFEYGEVPDFPKENEKDQVKFFFLRHIGDRELNEDAYDGFLKWFLDELLKEKGDELFRHRMIFIVGGQYMNSDVDYESNECIITEEATDYILESFEVHETVPTLSLCVYTGLRVRNPHFTRSSFSMNEHAWDELADLL